MLALKLTWLQIHQFFLLFLSPKNVLLLANNLQWVLRTFDCRNSFPPDSCWSPPDSSLRGGPSGRPQGRAPAWTWPCTRSDPCPWSGHAGTGSRGWTKAPSRPTQSHSSRLCGQVTPPAKIITVQQHSLIDSECLTKSANVLGLSYTVCFLDKWLQKKCKVTFDTIFWYRFSCSFTW